MIIIRNKYFSTAAAEATRGYLQGVDLGLYVYFPFLFSSFNTVINHADVPKLFARCVPRQTNRGKKSLLVKGNLLNRTKLLTVTASSSPGEDKHLRDKETKHAARREPRWANGFPWAFPALPLLGPPAGTADGHRNRGGGSGTRENSSAQSRNNTDTEGKSFTRTTFQPPKRAKRDEPRLSCATFLITFGGDLICREEREHLPNSTRNRCRFDSLAEIMSEELICTGESLDQFHSQRWKLLPATLAVLTFCFS